MQREDLPWDFNWSSIGLNWIDRNIKAKKIYDLYQQVLSHYMLELTKRLSCLGVPSSILKFYEQLFKKFTSEILYLILYKNNDSSSPTQFRRTKIFTETEKEEVIVSIFYEIFTSLLTNCLNCRNELVSIHISGSDLICSHCRERYEVKSTKLMHANTFFTGAPRGIYDLIHGMPITPQNPTSRRDRPGHLLVIVKNSIGLSQVRNILDSQIQVKGTDVVTKEKVVMSLDLFSAAKFAMFPSRSFREYSTKLTVEPDQFVDIELGYDNIKQLMELQNHLHFDEIGKLLLEFQRGFIAEVERNKLSQLTMEDEHCLLCPTVTLINQSNILDCDMMMQLMKKIQRICMREISLRINPHDSLHILEDDIIGFSFSIEADDISISPGRMITGARKKLKIPQNIDFKGERLTPSLHSLSLTFTSSNRKELELFRSSLIDFMPKPYDLQPILEDNSNYSFRVSADDISILPGRIITGARLELKIPQHIYFKGNKFSPSLHSLSLTFTSSNRLALELFRTSLLAFTSYTSITLIHQNGGNNNNYKEKYLKYKKKYLSLK